MSMLIYWLLVLSNITPHFLCHEDTTCKLCVKIHASRGLALLPHVVVKDKVGAALRAGERWVLSLSLSIPGVFSWAHFDPPNWILTPLPTISQPWDPNPTIHSLMAWGPNPVGPNCPKGCIASILHCKPCLVDIICHHSLAL